MEVFPAIVESMQSVSFPAHITAHGSACVCSLVGLQGGTFVV